MSGTKPMPEGLSPAADKYNSVRKMGNVRPHLAKALASGDGDAVYDALTGKQQAFVDAYLLDLNASNAARIAYDTDRPNVMASELMRNPGVRFAIDHLKSIRAEGSVVTSDYVLREVQKIIEDNKQGNGNVALRGLELLAKHLGMLKDRTEISGPDGEAIRYEQTKEEDATAFTSAIARLATRGGAGGVPIETDERKTG